ncbi:hypothetical protein HHI36_011574 [Cryptolaemus montrouzieri]|uniref:Uncharacterized protein n=1 Tax=Cryptolaemus montrouzieri TaxID=559131 RepID=A0ABD2MM61_9CUCU
MACFTAFFWSRRKEEGDVLTSTDNAPWFIGGIEPHRILPPPQIISKEVYTSYRSSNSFCDNLLSDLKFVKCDKKSEINSTGCSSDVFKVMSKSQLNDDGNNGFDTHTYNTDLEVNAVADTACDQQVAPVVLGSSSDELCDVAKSETKFFPEEDAGLSKNLDATMKRYRRTGVYEISNDSENKSSEFYQMKQNSVQETLVENIFCQIEKQTDLKKVEKGLANDNEKLTIPPVSGYCSSTASAGSEDEFDKAAFRKKIVRRCESSDSAIVYSDEETVTVHSNWGEKKEEIDELPYSYPCLVRIVQEDQLTMRAFLGRR